MIFSSLQYLIFLPIVVFLYWRTRGGARLATVVLASYMFYMSWLPFYGVLLFALTTLNWALALLAERVRGRSPDLTKLLLWLGLTLNLGCLCYYKYTNFFLQNALLALNWGKSWLPVFDVVPDWSSPMLEILLPLGISFFVFEFLHYIVDVCKGSTAVKSWWEFAAFAAFFPSQIAGPIKRFQDFIVTLRRPEPWSSSLFYEAMALIMQGLFKKVAIADPIGAVVHHGFSTSHALSCSDALIASIGFVVQVYCDFSGYTDMGRGSALLLGIRLPENFSLPYLAHDLADFWRRWHMSLSFWLRDYVYIPLGGSKCGRARNWLNLFLTMLACGLWHGAAWHYVIFGALQGAGLIINREWRNLLSALKPLYAASNTAPAKWLGTLLTMIFITLTYTIFRAPDMPHAMNVLSSIFNFNAQSILIDALLKSGAIQLTSVYFVYWLVSEALKRYALAPRAIWNRQGGYSLPLRLASWTAVVLLVIAAKPTQATPFVYFQF